MHKRKIFNIFAILLMAVFALTLTFGFACGKNKDDDTSDSGNEPEITEPGDEGSGDENPGSSVTVKDVTLSAQTADLVVGDEENGSTTLTATVTMSDNTSSYTGSYAWSSSDDKIATVDGEGNTATVTAVAEGTATITVIVDDNQSASCTVSVTAESSGTSHVHNYVAGDWLWATADDGTVTCTRTWTCTAGDGTTCDEPTKVDEATVSGPTITEKASCTEEGSATYTASFTEADGSPASIPDNVVEVPATGHTYPDPETDSELIEWAWTARNTAASTVKLHLSCSVCETEFDVRDVDYSDDTTAEGYITASIEIGGITYSDSYDTADDASVTHEHVYEAMENAWNWSEDYRSCTVTLTCTSGVGDCEAPSVPQTATVESDDTAPTCTENGYTTYTATVTYENTPYTNTVKVVNENSATGHTWDTENPKWDWDTKGETVSATITFTCSTCGAEEKVAATVSDPEVVEATCTGAGYTTYTATAAFGNATYNDALKIEGDPATGHTYDEGALTWTWTIDNEGKGEAVLSAECSVCHDTATETITDIEADEDGVYTATSSEILDANGQPFTSEYKPEAMSVEVNFSDPDSYAWIESLAGGGEETAYSTWDGKLSLTIAAGESKMKFGGTATNAYLQIGGDSSSSKGRYFTIDLSNEKYFGSYVTITVEVASSSTAAEGRSLYVDTQYASKPTVESTTALALVTSTASGTNGKQTLTFVCEITADLNIFYLTYDANLNIYSISVSITDEAELKPEISGVEIEGSSDGVTLTLEDGAEVTATLEAEVTMVETGTEYAGGYKWGITSSESTEKDADEKDLTVITIADNGDGTLTVTAVNAGTATITLALGDDPSKKVTVNITVEEAAMAPAVEKVELSETSLTIYKDAEEGTTLTATVTMSDGNPYDGEYTWSVTGDSGVIDITSSTASSVTITGLKSGTVTVTVTVEGESASCEVTVKANVVGISIDPSTATIAVGEDLTLTATVTLDEEGAIFEGTEWADWCWDWLGACITSGATASIGDNRFTFTITGSAAGEGQITFVTWQNGTSKYGSCTVTVTAATGSEEQAGEPAGEDITVSIDGANWERSKKLGDNEAIGGDDDTKVTFIQIEGETNCSEGEITFSDGQTFAKYLNISAEYPDAVAVEVAGACTINAYVASSSGVTINLYDEGGTTMSDGLTLSSTGDIFSVSLTEGGTYYLYATGYNEWRFFAVSVVYGESSGDSGEDAEGGIVTVDSLLESGILDGNMIQSDIEIYSDEFATVTIKSEDEAQIEIADCQGTFGQTEWDEGTFEKAIDFYGAGSTSDSSIEIVVSVDCQIVVYAGGWNEDTLLLLDSNGSQISSESLASKEMAVYTFELSAGTYYVCAEGEWILLGFEIVY